MTNELAKIDPGILGPVQRLQELGYETFGSCEGHPRRTEILRAYIGSSVSCRKVWCLIQESMLEMECKASSFRTWEGRGRKIECVRPAVFGPKDFQEVINVREDPTGGGEFSFYAELRPHFEEVFFDGKPRPSKKKWDNAREKAFERLISIAERCAS